MINKLIYWIDRKGLSKVRDYERTPYLDISGGINGESDYLTASKDSLVFNIIEKSILHVVLRFVKVPDPKYWPDLFTGPRKQVCEFLLDEYFRYDRRDRRLIVLEKAFYFSLKLWEFNQSYREVFDFLLYRALTKKGFKVGFDQPANLDPANWYMDSNPRYNGKSARVPPQEDAQYFKVVALTDKILITDTQLKKPVIMIRRVDDQLKSQYIEVDLRCERKIHDHAYEYPVIKFDLKIVHSTVGDDPR